MANEPKKRGRPKKVTTAETDNLVKNVIKDFVDDWNKNSPKKENGEPVVKATLTDFAKRALEQKNRNQGLAKEPTEGEKEEKRMEILSGKTISINPPNINNVIKIDTAPWVKKIEDFCNEEGITPDELIEGYKKKKATLKDILGNTEQTTKNYMNERRQKKGLI